MERLKYRILAYFVLCLKKDEHLKIDDVAVVAFYHATLTLVTRYCYSMQQFYLLIKLTVLYCIVLSFV